MAKNKINMKDTWVLNDFLFKKGCKRPFSGVVIDDRKFGKWVELPYRQGKLHGLSKNYEANGNLECIDVFNNDEYCFTIFPKELEELVASYKQIVDIKMAEYWKEKYVQLLDEIKE